MNEMYDFKKFRVGQTIEGEVVQVDDNEVSVYFNYFTEGTIYLNELTLKKDVSKAYDLYKVGDKITAVIKKMTDEEIFLSRIPIEREENLKKIKNKFDHKTLVKATVKEDKKTVLVVTLYGVEAIMPKSEVDVDNDFDGSTLMNQEIKVKIIECDLKGKRPRIVVSRKAVQLQELYKERIANYNQIELGASYEGEVVRVENYGVLVVANNYQGLVPAREISHLPFDNINDVIKVGDKVNVKVMEKDEQKLQVLYSIRALLLKPWDILDQEVNAGDVIEGTIVRTTDFGAFINVAPQVDGLLHVSEYSYNPNINMFDEIEEGQKVKVKVLSLDRNRERLSLSVKALKEDPWKAANIKRFDIVDVTVVGFENNDAVIEYTEDVVGILPRNQISSEKRITSAQDELQVGQTVQVKVTEFDPANRRFAGSIRRIKEDAERREFQKFMQTQDEVKNDTLGDIFGEKLKSVLKNDK